MATEQPREVTEALKAEVKAWDDAQRAKAEGKTVKPGFYEITDLKAPGPILKISVARGRNLINLDVGDKSDPYVVIVLSDSKGNKRAPIKSKVINNNLNPEWNWVVDQTGSLTDNSLAEGVALIELWDRDVGKDEFMGHIEFDLGKINGKNARGEFALLWDANRSSRKASKNLGHIWIDFSFRAPEATAGASCCDSKSACETKSAEFESPEQRSRREAFATGNPGLPPKVGELVFSSFGPGVVASFKPESQSYEVIPAWRLADEGKVHAFLHIESVFKDDYGTDGILKRVSAASLFANVIAPGTKISSPFGTGRVVFYDIEAGNYKIELTWELAEGAHAIVFAQPDVVTPHRAVAGDLVLTPYGTGEVVEVRDSDGCHVVNVKQLSGDMTCYLDPSGILRKLPAIVGQYARTSYGNAFLLTYRPEDSVFTVRLPYAIGYIQPEEISAPYTPDASITADAREGDDGQGCAVQ